MTLTETIDTQFAEFARVQRANSETLADMIPPPVDALVRRFGAINAEILRQFGLLTVTTIDAAHQVFEVARTGASDLVETGTDAAETSLGVVRKTGRQVVGDARQARSTILNRASSAADDLRRSLRLVSNRAETVGDKVADAAEDATDRVVKATDTGVAEVASEGASRPSGSYENWTKDELYERASELDVEGRSSMNKRQLIAALRSA